MFFKTKKKLKESKEIIEDLLVIIDQISDEFTEVRQHDIRCKRAKEFIEKKIKEIKENE